MNFASASVFMIVVLPMRVNCLFDHCLQTPSTFLIISIEFKSQILYISVENVTPKILKGPCVQSNVYYDIVLLRSY